MFLSTGGTNISVPINSGLMALDDSKVFLQAHLGNNMAATTFVSGNSNVVADTRRTGSWKFYVAGNTSVAAITGTSASSEWTSGSLLTYSADDYSVFYPFNTNTVTGSTVLNKATNAYDLTLYGGASIINTVPSPASQPPATGSGYLQMNTSVGQYAQATQLFSLNPAGSTISLWFRWTAGSADVPIFSYDDGTNFVLFYIFSEVWFVLVKKIGGTQTPAFNFNATQENITIGNWVHITILTSTGTTYVNGVLSQQPSLGSFSSFTQPTKFYLGNSSATSSFLMDGRDFATKTGTIGVDNFVIYNKTLTTTEIMTLYAKPNLYYPMDVADINPGNTLQVGDVSTGPYVYNGTLVNGATIVADAGSRIAGQGYLKLVKASGNYFNFNPTSVTTSGFTIAIWFRATSNNVTNSRIFDMFANGGANLSISIRTSPEGIDFQYSANLNLYTGTVRDNVWRHITLTISYAGASGASSIFKCYIDGTLQTTYTSAYPTLGSKSNYNLGTFLNLGNGGNESFDGGLDDFRIYNRVITDAEISYLYNGPSPPTIKDDATGVTWMPIPATPVDASETSYTVKNNEIALKPGTNSTFAVWTATKFTNLKIDVSFADYHTRSAGVGFQMFKIKSDNTFDSVLFPRTVTSTALTNAAPNNYLPVPTVSTTVTAGDKIYIRIDANGNTTGASSVLATTIFTDAVSIATNPVETKVLQANLAANLNATTFVSGNANVVLDTLGTSNWQFYVAPSTSVAAITSASASSEWTGGSLLGAQYAFDGTLVNGATIVVDAGSRVPGNPYLKLSNPVILTNSQYAKFTPVSIPSGGMSFSMWVKHTHVSGTYPFFMSIRTGLTNIDMGLNNTSLHWYGQAGGTRILVGFFSTITDGNWHHLVWTISASGMYNFYLDNSLKLTQQSTHPGAGLRSTYNLGGYNDQSDPLYAVNGGIDNFKFFSSELTASEVTAEYNNTASSMPFMLMTDSGAAPKWTIKPATVADPSETNYTIKSNEVALTPGTNSTYAVWTAPKSTNIRVDVSFADYHTRNVGVGFQMFKINADNTFGSVIYPRTVTSTALTNANPNNYLSVPSKTISVATGDKLYYRVDANGNTVAASSVLSTNIYVDPNQDLKQPILLQAHLGNNMAATTFVSGNSNVVADTRGTGSWKFYAANSNSIASITGLSNSTEWTSGSLLTYSAADYSVFYPFNTNTVSGSTVLNMATNAYDLTLYGGASIINTTPFPATQPPSTGSGYLNMNIGAGHYAQPTQPYSFNPLGSTFSFWVRWTNNVDAVPIFSYGTGSNFFVVTLGNNGAITWSIRNGASQGSGFIAYQGGGFPFNYAHITLVTGTGAVYINGVLGAYGNYTLPTYGASIQPTWFYFGNYDPAISNIAGLTRDFSTKAGTIGIDNFVVYNKTLTATEVMSLYAKSDLHYPFDVADINPGNPLQVGDVSTGPYVYNGTLVNGATIAVDSGSRIAGQGYLKLVSASGHTMNTGPFNVTTSGLSFSFWFRATSSTNFGRIIFSSEPYIFISVYFADLYMGINGLDDVSVGEAYLDNVWRHSVFTIQYGGVGGASSVYKTYVNGVLRSTFTQPYPALGIRSSSTMGDSMDGGIDDFRIYHRVITDAEISYLYNGPPQITLKDDATGVAWMPIPATPVDASETSYTIKNNEVALKPGTNSTFAVWTATKFTNIKVDVSFADYHTRSSAGVGFQMFKIKSDNTFDSVLFPRTVTSTALTNAAPTNYLPVPTVSTSVSAGDKIYLRVDANGNTTAASSVLATTIFTDAVSVANNPVENRLLQAHLGNNLNATTFVSGNANVVLDTLGTSNWQFYVAPSTSVAAITSSSASSEWTGGSLLGAQYAFDGTLVNGATIVVDAGSRVPGNPYLKMLNPSGTISANTKYAKITPFSIPSGGMSFSVWAKHTYVTGNAVFFVNIRVGLPEIFLALTQGGELAAGSGGATIIVNGYKATITDGNWHHLVLTISASGLFKFYLDNSLISTNQSTHPGAGLRTFYNIGSYGDSGDIGYAVNGAIDNYKFFSSELTASEVTAEYNNTASSMPFMLMTDSGAAPKWSIKPATVADPSETSYTVKSNEIAIAPGTNSTYAVWTAPKSTNIKVDVSFADYHSRNVGVGFQMFKINSDNTFGSVIYPRTVTSTALTNAAPTNYLSVPSRTISVATGDKLYYRVDANGNPTSASSVLATTIYVDPNQDLKQYNVLQANLGNNIAATTFVSGNSNVVADTRGTGNWQFYVAGNTSVAAITGTSNSTEWTVGNLLSYDPGPIVLSYSFDTTTQTGSTVKNTTTNSYDLTLYNGATIATASPAPNSTENAGYLSINVTSGQYAQSSATLPLSQPFSISFWFKRSGTGPNVSATMFEMGDSNLNAIRYSDNNVVASHSNGSQTETGALYSLYYGDANWHHLVFVLNSGSLYSYGDGSLSRSMGTQNYNVTSNFTYFSFGKSYIFPNPTSGTTCIMNIDKFQIFNTALSGTQITALYNGTYIPPTPTLKHVASGATWISKPSIAVDSTETNYTIKSNEIALTPGTNSTYAVWTATKSTNLKIDVSFADYHSRSAGVGFQMFKIKSDNTFDSVLFPRTVTSTALTNAAPNNYLPVPSVTTSMNNGDKIYLRIDANGNTTAASSVLATTIFTDAVSIATNPAETRVLQANLASNLNATTLVSGNANTVLDTVGTGNWKFYVAPSTSVAEITSATSSTEWTGGSLLSYNEIDYYMFYPFNTNSVSGSTLLNLATNSYGATLYGGASIVNTAPSPATQPPAIGSGYLNMDIGAGQYVQLNQTVTLNSSGSTISFWFRWSANVSNDGTPIFSYDDGTDYLIIYMWGNGVCVIYAKRNGITNGAYVFGTNDLAPFTIGDWVHLSILTGTGKTYVNGIVLPRDTINGFSSIQPTKMYFGNSSASASFLMDNRTFSTKSGTVGIDNFVIHNKTLSDEEIGALYSNSRIYYTFDSDSVTGINVGNKSKGTYVNDATLVNGASIVSTAFTFSVVNSGSGAYLINTVSNATINLVRGGQYTFNINASGHPFWIQTSTTPYNSANVYSTGITNNGVQVGTLTFNVPMDAPNTLYYVCQFHGSMYGIINIGTSNPSPAPTSGTGHLQLTSTNTIATNQYVQLSVVPNFIYQSNKTSFSVSFWARSNSSLGSSAKNNFFDFANSIAASENANYSFSLYLQSNNIRGKISYGATGVAADDYVIHTDSSILTDNVWRHYVWTVSSGYGIDNVVRWKLYINSVLVFTKSSGFNLGYPMDYHSTFGNVSYTSCFIGRDAGSWQTASFSGAIDEFRWYKSRVIGQAEVSVLYATQVSVGKFQNPSGGNPTWIAKPTFAVDSTETLYTIKSNEIAIAPGTNSTYAVWTAPKSTNIRVDVSFADYHSRSSAGVGFQMFKINNDNTFGSTIFPRTVTSTALTNAAPTNYLNVPSVSLSVTAGDKLYYRVDANGNTTSASSVISTNIYSYTGKWN